MAQGSASNCGPSRQMKGFMHIVEIIIVVLAMFLVLLQLLNTPRIDSDWSGIALSTKANDLLHSLDTSGIDWFNSSQVSSAIAGAINTSSTLFSVKLRNVMPPLITVGCMCNDAELNQIKDALRGDFRLNGQSTAFSVEKIDDNEMSFDYDVVVVMGRNMSYENARSFLETHGGGIVEVRNLGIGLAGQGMGEEYMVHNEFFGLSYDSNAPNPYGEASFAPDASLPDSDYYSIYNYFSHIPNGTGEKIAQPHQFTGLLRGGQGNELIRVSGQASALVTDSAGAPALVANKAAIGGKGRAAWLSAPESGSLSGDDITVLLKSLVVWASGEEYDAVPSIIMSNPVQSSMIKVYNHDMMQPVEISLSLGNVYG